MKISYQFQDDVKGRIIETIEVDEYWGNILVEFDNQEAANDKKETRRHASLDAMEYEGEFFATNDSYFEKMFDGPDYVDRLHNAMKMLTPKQKELLKALYFDGVSQEEYAEKLGINQCNVSRQLHTIFKKIKKFF